MGRDRQARSILQALTALVAIILVSQAIASWRAVAPAQDAITFFRIAERFHNEPWQDVVRTTDQHPLYPALLATVQPACQWLSGWDEPTSWHRSGQAVALMAWLASLTMLHGLLKSGFGAQVANLTTLVAACLPLSLRIGRDPLSDSLGLLGTMACLRLGEAAVRRFDPRIGVATGTVAALGYWARPEVILAALAVGIRIAWVGRSRLGSRSPSTQVLVALGLSLLIGLGLYTTTKGRLSDKLAIRAWSGQAAVATSTTRAVPRWLPEGLDDPSWNYAPKEEMDQEPLSPALAMGHLLSRWSGGLEYLGVPLILWGMIRHRRWANVQREGSGDARAIVAIFLTLIMIALLKHAMSFGYISERHLLSACWLTLPWAILAWILIGERIAHSLRVSSRVLIPAAVVTIAILSLVSTHRQADHLSRWGQVQAGHWLQARVQDHEAVLDTRGWASFLADVRAYDPWHIRQALTDASLSYVVVTGDELHSTSERAKTLRALLDHAGTLVASFPDRPGRRDPDVQIYRFDSSVDWTELTP